MRDDYGAVGLRPPLGRIITGVKLSAVYWLKPNEQYTVHELAEMHTVLLIDGLPTTPAAGDT